MALTIGVDQVEGDPRVAVLTLDGELDASNYEGVIDTRPLR